MYVMGIYNKTDATSGAGTACLSGTPKFNLGLSEVPVALFLAFRVVICRPLFVLLSVEK